MILCNWIFLSWFTFFHILRAGAVEADSQRQIQAAPFGTFDPNAIRFYLFYDQSRRSLQREIILGDSVSLQESGLGSNEKIRMFTHGFLHNYTTGGCIPLKNAFLKRNYKNFICVDWGKLSASMVITPADSYLVYGFYPIVFKATKVVGHRIADFLLFLKDHKVFNSFDDVHLIALSLGAHASGMAGGLIKERTKEAIGRITGLDPAGPIFDLSLTPSRNQLDQTKAKFVDVLHTDAGVLGTKRRRGHLDFWANGGRSTDQPFCDQFIETITGCGHSLSVDYYERAILGENLVGCPCKFNMKAPLRQPCPKPSTCQLTVKFGFPVSKTMYGSYYLGVPLHPPPSIASEYEPHRTKNSSQNAG